MNNVQSDYTLSWQAASTKSKIILRCERDKQVIFSDETNIQVEKQRKEIADKLVALHCDRSTVERELLAIAAEAANVAKSEPVLSGPSDEIERSAVHRPERFILDGANGLTVPIVTRASGGVAGQSMAYILDHGKRRCERLMPQMSVGESSIYLDPVPPDPDVTTRLDWSRRSREAWLAGGASVEPAELFERLVETIDRYLEFPKDQQAGTLLTLATWIVMTYHYHAWDSVGYLLVNGPPSSGKSTLFKLLNELCFRPFNTDNTSSAVVFRTLHSYGGTFLFDEAERLRDTKSPDILEINSILLAGYKRGGSATRLEKIGDTFKAVGFQVYGPKAIACINGVPPALQSRCIEIHTQRAGKHSPKPKRSMDDTDWQSIRDDLHVLSIDHGNDWVKAATCREVGKGLNGRDWEVWQPLLSIGAFFESSGVAGLVPALEQFATENIVETADQRTPEADETLLRMLVEFVREGKRPIAAEILDHAVNESKAMFGTWSAKGVSNRLRAYGLKPTKVMSRREYRQSLSDLREVSERYSIDVSIP